MIVNNSAEAASAVRWEMYALGAHRLCEGTCAAQCKGHVIDGVPGEMASGAGSVRAKAAYNQLAALPGVQDSEVRYEVRALCIHALNLKAMWLHAVAGGADRVVPYGSYISDLQVGQEYSLAEFLRIARREAAKLKLQPTY